MTRNELKKYNGKNGAKAYVAYKNTVYDVTNSALWKEGEHEGMHSAGEDLTLEFAGAPHATEVFADMPVVGDLEEEPPEQKAFEAKQEHLQRLYKKFHPHPMLVHFPIALHLFAALMDIIFFIAPKPVFAISVFSSLVGATGMGLFALFSGIVSWQINYNGTKHYIFMVKLSVAILTILLGIAAIVIYIVSPSIIYTYSFWSISYHFIVLFTGLCVIVLGYYGGKITWGSAFKEQEGTTEDEPQSATPVHKSLKAPELKKAVDLHVNQSESKNVLTLQSISILIGGAAGSGIDSLEKILSQAFRKSGYYVFSTKEYMSRVRGGSNTALLRIGNTSVNAPCWEVDIAVALDKDALQHMQERFSKKTVVLADEGFHTEALKAFWIPLKENIKQFGNFRYANTYMAGVLFSLLGLSKDMLLQSVMKHFEDATNKDVVESGYTYASSLTSIELPKLPSPNTQAAQKMHLLDGSSACGFGFLTGGCDMITAYPMSPSTGVLNFMAGMSKEFDIAVEQSEDEIASLMMTLGGWYGGARAMTSTSGGGFALMGEALSLSGMTETPAVIYLAQRPGPATGLPTRSEQGDLNMVIYAGHGPFARAVLAPGSLEECIECGYLAFELADRFQIPVIVMSDQYLADSIAMIEDIDFHAYEQRRYIQESSDAYKRYELTSNGITPRAVPGYGEGIVCASSDEHDERGQITENYKVRDAMIQKRAKKKETLTKEALAPTCKGDGDIAVVGWGSTRGAIEEALQRLDNKRLASVHFMWVHPLAAKQLKVLKTFKYIIVVENNADGAFADQLRLHGVQVDKQILQSNGFSFFADQLEKMLEDTVEELS